LPDAAGVPQSDKKQQENETTRQKAIHLYGAQLLFINNQEYTPSTFKRYSPT
jgi:hypothetical protein